MKVFGGFNVKTNSSRRSIYAQLGLDMLNITRTCRQPCNESLLASSLSRPVPGIYLISVWNQVRLFWPNRFELIHLYQGF